MRALILITAGAMMVTLPACGGTTEPGALPRLASAGWSFGFCAGPCRGELTPSGGALSYRITDWPGAQVFLTTNGSLTSRGASRLRNLVDALPTALQETYGCPDCADGGAASVTVETNTGSVTSTYEYARPPNELEALDAFLRNVMDALEACTTTTDVAPAPDCEPRGAH